MRLTTVSISLVMGSLCTFWSGCGQNPSNSSDDPILKQLLMPAGKDLKPNDSNKPGDAHPQGVVVVGQKAYVTLTNLVYDETGKFMIPAGPGFVQVVDLPQWTNDKLIELASTNAGSIHRPPSGGDRLYVSCATTFDGSGKVAIVDMNTDSAVSTVNIGGAPGQMWVDENQTAWVGDMFDGRLLRFSTKKDESILDPIELCPADYANKIYDYVTDVASDEQGKIFASCFATNTVHILDSSSNDPISTDIKVVVGDGPQSLLVLQQKDIQAVVLNNLGETISLIGIDNPPTVHNNVATVGVSPNQLLLDNDELLVLNSTSHSLDVLDVGTWSIVREYSLGQDCNPWNMALTEDDKLLVTCWQSNKLLLVDPRQNVQ